MGKAERGRELRRALGLLEDWLAGGFSRSREQGEGSAEEAGAAGPEAAVVRAAEPVDAAPPADLAEIAARVSSCRRCRLAESRARTVPGEGASRPCLLLVGEGPGEEEDRTGRPFVGKAGQYLDKWLAAIQLDRAQHCFIANVVKCRPPGNRDPRPDEYGACLPFLEAQTDLLKPRAILTLGRISTQILSGRAGGIGSLRGKTYAFRGIPLIPTYHPSAVLRDPSLRPAVWEDLKRLAVLLKQPQA